MCPCYPLEWGQVAVPTVLNTQNNLQRFAGRVELAACFGQVAGDVRVVEHGHNEHAISASLEHQEAAATRVSFFVSFPRSSSSPSPSLSPFSKTRCDSRSPLSFRS